MTHKGSIHIGTSGWQYRHWAGVFYPKELGAAGYLPAYARSFETVEVNTTFYGLPKTDTVAQWREQTPQGFLFACKASRYITHMKKLKDPEAGIEPFFGCVEALGEKLGPILFQLPPRWRVNEQRLRAFLKVLPRRHRYAFEFRDPSWLTESVYERLRDAGAACCLHDFEGRQSPEVDTAAFRYVRLHGPGAAYRGSYTPQRLSALARKVGVWRDAGQDVYCYFDNDEAAHAAKNALKLNAFVKRRIAA